MRVTKVICRLVCLNFIVESYIRSFEFENKLPVCTIVGAPNVENGLRNKNGKFD